MIKPISVLLPLPLEPTSAVVEPAEARKLTSRSTGTPAWYSKSTCSKATSPRISGIALSSWSCSSSVAIWRTSRIRSSPANASEICVPMDAICTTGATSSATNAMYITRSPSVIRPLSTSGPAIVIMSTLTAPTTTVAKAVTIDTPFSDAAMLRKSRWTPRAKVTSSRRSAT
jgi:hypothetical protein